MSFEFIVNICFSENFKIYNFVFCFRLIPNGQPFHDILSWCYKHLFFQTFEITKKNKVSKCYCPEISDLELSLKIWYFLGITIQEEYLIVVLIKIE